MAMKYDKLRLINPPFHSPVTDYIIDINYLRKRQFSGSTHPEIFFQLKNIFHMLESIGSTRIEGNHTTIAEFVDSEIEDGEIIQNEGILEIKNNEKALDFIESVIETYPINRAFICELHKIVVNGLKREGSKRPGQYRVSNPKITGSRHIPPDFISVNDLMDELYSFINENDPDKYDLIKVAIAHHRFVWVHPFDNGNGRTVRLLTYAMLVKMGFKVNSGRIINPTAVFCSDRDAYYTALQKADEGTDNGLLEWSKYMLEGLSIEIKKIDNLLEYEYVNNKILIPSLRRALSKKIISEEEHKILLVVIETQEFQTAHLRKTYPKKDSVELSRMVKKLRDKKYLIPIDEKSRIYMFNFMGNELLREIMKSLDSEGFLPLQNEI